jgi:3'(2'), 5'-bisphosphate nucleotidase
MSEPMSPEEVERDLQFAIEAARVAGERVTVLRETERWEGPMLADIGDQAADGYLQGLIAGRYPDDGILSEETRDSEARLSKERSWIIDPLDGTREYSQLREDWAVHVALTIGGHCALAAVGLPAQNCLLWGVALPGSERAGIIGEGELATGDTPSPDAPRIACSRSHTPAWMERFSESLSAAELIPAGSVGNKVGMLLLGVADVYVHRIGLKEWDTCAPETVARALGWSVCKLHGEEHIYNRPDPVNHEFVMCRPAWTERVVAALAACGALELDD